MADPVSGIIGTKVVGKGFDFSGRVLRKISFSWRIAYRARAAAAEDGYAVSLKELRLVTRQRVVKRAVRSQRIEDVSSAEELLSHVRAIRPGGERMPTGRLYALLRTAYLGAADQAERDLGIRDETRAGLEQVALTGGGREALWKANLAKLPPVFGADALSLRELYGDGVTKLVHEIANSLHRVDTLRSWATVRPSWLPAEGRVFGWLGELSYEIDEPATSRMWFASAVAAGAEPIEYWRVREAMSDIEAKPEERGASIADLQHHPLVVAVTAPDFQVRLDQIRRWEAASAVQKSMQMSLIVDYLVSLQHFDEAIDIGLDAFERQSLSGPGTNAVEAYLRRSGRRPGAHAMDLSAGLTLALKIRDARRLWGVSSGIATAKAVKAAVMLSDIERALELTRVPEATAHEAQHSEVRREAIVAMTMLDDIEGARELIDDATPVWVRRQLEAREAELLGDQGRANTLLTLAIDAADDPAQKAGLCFRLASRGVIHSFVDEIRELNPETAADLEIVAALANGESGAEQRARKVAANRPTIAIPLIEYFDETGRRLDLIAFAERTASKWADPDLWLKAAHAHRQERNYADAIDRASKALDAGGNAWGRRASAYVIQIEAATALGDWTTALTSAQALIRDRPGSLDARWALVRIHRSSGDVDEAYEAWRAGSSPAPRNVQEAAVWLELFRIYGNAVATLPDFFEVATRFSSDAQIRNMSLNALLKAPLPEEVGELNFGTLLAQFEEDYPGEHGLRTIAIGEDANGHDILAAIEAEIGPQDESRKQLLDGAAKGALPVGFVARNTGRHIAELLNVLHRSAHFAGQLTGGNEDEAAADALQSGCVIDVTALFTLTLLKQQYADLLETKFSRLISTSEQMLDASAAREAFNRDAGGNFFRGTADEPAFFREDDPIEREVQKLNSTRLVDWFRRTDHRAGRPTASPIAKELGENEVWVTALDLATRLNLPFWCDDSATRAMAQLAGAKVFGTPALIEVLRQQESLTQLVADQIDADLICNFTVGVAYRSSVYDLAGRNDQMAPHGLAVAILNGGQDHADDKVDFIVRAIGNVLALPDQVSDWSAVAFRYLGELAEQKQMAHENRAMFLSRLLIQAWMSPSVLLFVVNAGRTVIALGWPEDFREGVRRTFEMVAQESDRATAARFVLAQVGELGDEERQLALSVILER